MQAPAERPVKTRAAYLSPSHLVIGANLCACLCRWLPVILAGDLNAKHVDWRGEICYVVMLLEMAQQEGTLHVRIR
jgi:hypothetical protein